MPLFRPALRASGSGGFVRQFWLVGRVASWRLVVRCFAFVFWAEERGGGVLACGFLYGGLLLMARCALVLRGGEMRRGGKETTWACCSVLLAVFLSQSRCIIN